MNDELKRKFKEKMEEYRKKVIDTSNKNRLVNFKPYSWGLDIQCAQLDEFIKNFLDSGSVLLTDEENESNSKNTFLKVKNPKAVTKLAKRSREYFVETGINTVFLATGFLSWEDGPNEKRRSPLVLIPVSLKKDPVSRLGYSIAYDGDPIEQNYPAYARIKKDFQLSLPEIEGYDFENKNSLKDYFDRVEARINMKDSELNLDRETCYISSFEMKKMSIYEDLDCEKWINTESVLSNKNITRLFHDVDNENQNKMFSTKKSTIRHVVDADKSQKLALEKVMEEESFVIQGPPGTGKSQTIFNIICSAVADKKRFFSSRKNGQHCKW